MYEMHGDTRACLTKRNCLPDIKKWRQIYNISHFDNIYILFDRKGTQRTNPVVINMATDSEIVEKETKNGKTYLRKV